MKSVNNEYKLLGLDDTGRGTVLGSMFMAGVLVPLSKVDILKGIQVTDSKLLSKKLIIEKAEEIMTNFPYKVVECPATQVDKYNLNDLEAKAFYDIYKVLGDEKTIVYVDNSDIDRERFLKRLRKLGCVLTEEEKERWVISHHADLKYPPCSAASIVGEYIFLKHVEELHQTYGDVGSLYCWDTKTIEFLKQNLNNLPDIVRTRYSTVQNLFQRQLF